MSFKSQMAADQATFFNTNEFADLCDYKAFGTGTETKNVPVVIASQGDGRTDYGHANSFIIALPVASVSRPRRNDSLTCNGLEYTITGIVSGDAVIWTVSAEAGEGRKP